MEYLKRDIEAVVKKAVEQFPAVIVTGPRQSGKTTLLKHLFSKTHKYVSLDNPDVRSMADKDPGLFLANYPPPVIIDEVQYAPGLFPYLKILIDENRDRKGQFILTGSQTFSLMSGVTESLAGRIAVFTLLSLSLKERTGPDKDIGLDFLKKTSLRGGFPEIALDEKADPRLWFNGYLQTYLERDVRQMRNIGDLTDFQRFLELAASLNGQVLKLSEISGDLGVAVNTVKAWISVLEASNQVALIKPFYRNKGKRIIKSPKIYFLDSGLLCFLSGIMLEEQLFKGRSAGHLFESIVLGELVRTFTNAGEVPRIYWWRTSHGQEVDLIVEKGGRTIPLEVKMTTRVNRDMAGPLESFCELFPEDIDKGYLINLAPDSMKIGDKIEAKPFPEIIKKPIL